MSKKGFNLSISPLFSYCFIIFVLFIIIWKDVSYTLEEIGISNTGDINLYYVFALDAGNGFDPPHEW